MVSNDILKIIKKDKIPYLKNITEFRFIHIPKTSGTKISSGDSKKIIFKRLYHCFCSKAWRLNKSEGGSHYYNTNFYSICYIKPNQFHFTVIRNPFDLLSSYYFHGKELLKNNNYIESGWASVNYTHQFESFEQFIKAYCDENFKWHVPKLKQFLFSQIFDDNGDCKVDFIIKYENIEKSLSKINSIYQEDIFNTNYNEIKNISRRKTKKYWEYYTPELKELVHKKCKRELEIFQYTFKPLMLNDNPEFYMVKNTLKIDWVKDEIYFQLPNGVKKIISK